MLMRDKKMCIISYDDMLYDRDIFNNMSSYDRDIFNNLKSSVIAFVY